MRRFGCATRAALVAGLALVLSPGVAAALSVGDPAPEFVLDRAGGGKASLKDFVGTRGFVLAWFPKAFTPG